MIDRLLAWWRRPGIAKLDFGGSVVVTVRVTGSSAGTYRLDCGARTIEVRRRWWDSNRSIARRLKREFERR